MSDPVTYALSDRIATVKLDDGKVNVLSIATLEALHAALNRAEADEAVVLLSGREGYLSAGFDLKVFQEQPERIVEMLTLGATLCERILGFPTPVLVAAGGHAIAAGSFLLLAADVRIGAEGPFKIGLNEAQIGLTLPLFAVELARQRLTPAEFNRGLTTAKMYAPEEAAAAGFLDRVVPATELEAVAAEAAAQLATLDPAAHRGTKQRVREGALLAIRAGIDKELRANQGGGSVE